MTKGFLTLATGHERYFKMALNLLHSYKVFSNRPLPFAILTDRQNEYTAQFDEVIILDDCYNSYLDKLSILKNCPYDQTIYIDADCLAYGDLNNYWNIYDFQHPFSCFGSIHPLEYQEGWFKIDGIGEYRKLVNFIPKMHGGCYFLNKKFRLDEFYALALSINNNYHKYKFNHFDQPADEPILALCMSVFNSPPILSKNNNELVFFPSVDYFESDILKGYNKYRKNGNTIYNCILVHWQNYNTERAIYKSEVTKLNYLMTKKNSLLPDLISLVNLRLKQFLFRYVDFSKDSKLFIKRVIKKLSHKCGFSSV